MGKVKLGDIAVLINGDRGKNYPSQKEIITSGGIPFVNAGHLNGRAIEFEAMNYITPEKYEKLNSGKFQQNDILYCLRGSLGKKALINDNIYGAIASSLVIIRPNLEKVRPQYLMLALETPLIKEQLFKFNNGSSQPNLSAKSVKEYKLELPDLFIQDSIISKLEKVRNLIEDEKQEKLLLDNLIQARFVEMFGDCTNMISLSDLCLIITDGTHQSPKFQHEGIPFILVSNLSKNTVTYDTDKFISAETYKELYKRTPIEIGDILLSTVGSYGHPAVVVEDRKFLFQRHIAYLKPKSDILNSYYMHGALLSPGCQRQIEEKVKGIAQKTLNLSEIRKIRIPVPSLDLQKQYADFVHQVNKSKFDTMTFAPIYAIINLYLHTYFYQGRR